MDTCVEPGGCQSTVRAGRCLIGGVCRDEGDVSADLGSCGLCAPAINQHAWAARGGTNRWPLADGYWADSRDVPTLTRYCNPIVVACHNCYVESTSSGQSLSHTRSRILNAIQTGSDAVVSDGFDRVELEYTQGNLLGRLAYARSKGLATGVWTVPVFLGEPLQASLQELVDLVVTDMVPALANAVAVDVRGLIHIDATALAPAASSIPYLRATLTPATASVGIPNTPLLLSGAPFHGTSMGFERASMRSLTTWDADQEPGDGYLVMATVSFGELTLADFETQVIVGKADAGGFSLEVANAADGLGTALRFGVHVGGSYIYASRPATTLSTGRAYLVIGAYDGSGGVRLLVDGSDANVQVASATGQVTPNDSPVVIGADPQGAATRRWWFTGRIQTVHVASWPQF